MATRRLWCGFSLFLTVAVADIASAQVLVNDARLAAMGGGSGHTPNIAMPLVSPATRSAAVGTPIPIGLVQVFQGGFDKFKPSSDGFDPLLALETAGNPFYYRLGADASTRTDFVRDMVNGSVDPDLTAYAGFKIPENYSFEALLAPQFGTTFRFVQATERFHGLYLGAGAYFSYATEADVDPRLADILGNGALYPNASMPLLDQSQVQQAAALTVGYRGKVPFGSRGGWRDGTYLAYNFHYLKGFKYYGPDLNIRFNTDGTGNLTPSETPFSMFNVESDSGSGFAQDVGVQFVRGSLQFGVGVNGIGNRITWSGLTAATYTLPSLTAGSGFIKTPGTAPYTELVVKLPVVKTANVAFDWSGWSAVGTITDGYNGTSYLAGLERQAGPVAVRGGIRHYRGFWNPSVGVGVGKSTGVDVAVFSTHANFQNERQWALAASVRVGR